MRECGKNTAERGRPQMTIWRMSIACWIPKATNTHTGCVILIAFPLQQLHERASMLKVKVREAGVYWALQLEETDCTLTPWRSSLIHLHRRHHTKRRESPLLAKEGTFIEGILLAIRNLLQLLGSLTCRKVGTWDTLFNFPSEGRHAENFVHRKNLTASARFEPANSGTRGQHSNH
jgi:hypothetical protein